MAIDDRRFDPDDWEPWIALAMAIRRAREKRKKEEELRKFREKYMLEAARERQRQEDLEATTGWRSPEYGPQISNLEARLQQVGVDPNKDDRNWFERWMNLDKDQGWFFDTLEVLGRGSTAVLNVMKDKIKDVKSQKTWQGKLAQLVKEIQPYNASRGVKTDPASLKEIEEDVTKAYRGFRGFEKTQGSDVLEELGWEEPGMGRAVAGFLLDVAADPLTYTGVGVASRLGQATRAGVSKLPGGAKAVEKTTEALNKLSTRLQTSRVGRLVDEFFGTAGKKYTLDNEISDELIDIDRWQRATARFSKDFLMQHLANAMRRSGGYQTGEELTRLIEAPLERQEIVNRVIEEADKVIKNPTKEGRERLRKMYEEADEELKRISDFQWNAPPELRAAMRDVQDTYELLREWAAREGVEIPDWDGYITHVMREEIRELMRKTPSRGFKKRYGGGDPKITQRTIDKSVKDANEYLKAKYGIDEDWFHTNAWYSAAVGIQQWVNYVVKEAAKKKILSNPKFARPYKKGMEIGKHEVKMEISPGGPEYVLTKGARDVLVGFERATSHESIEKFIKGWGELNRWWKKLALFTTGFHARNVLGSLFNQHVRGMNVADLVRYNKEATLDLLTAMRGLSKHPSEWTEKEYKAILEYNEFRRQGLQSVSQYEAEFVKRSEPDVVKELEYLSKTPRERALYQLTLGKLRDSSRPLSDRLDAPFEASRKFGEMMDEIARFALFKWARKKKGMNAKEAANVVRETLFDYFELTPFEKGIRDTLVPFYTWLRKNTVFMLKWLPQNPKAFSRVNMALEEAYANVDQEERSVPEWLKEQFAIPLGGGRFFTPGLPLADISKLTDMGKTALDMLSPTVKLPAELILNQSFFMEGMPLEEFADQRGEFFGLPVGKKTQYALEQIPLLRNLNQAWQSSGGLEALLKATGMNLFKEYDPAALQRQVDYKERERLQDMVQKFEEETGKEVPEYKELERAGIVYGKPGSPTYKKYMSSMEKLRKMGLSEDEIRFFASIKRDVMNRDEDYAAETAAKLEAFGVPEEIIKEVVKDHLKTASR